MEEPRTRLQNSALLALAVMAVVFGMLTFVSRAHRGVEFEGAILKAEETGDGTAYFGKVHGEAVSVSVTRADETMATVTYAVGDRIHDIYGLEYPLAPIPAVDGPMEGRTVDGVRITKNGALLFEGGYDMEISSYGFGWYDAAGRRDTDVYSYTVTGVGGGEDAAPDGLTKRQVLAFAQGPELTARGSLALYLLMVFLSGLLALDLAFPLTVFRLQHCCDVRDPQPSDFYLSMQRVGWVVYPVLLLFGYIWALRALP